MRKKAAVTAHIILLNGLRNAQGFEFNVVLTGATTTSPDSMYGCVKSAILVLLVVIAISPTTASYSYIEQETGNQKKHSPSEIYKEMLFCM